MSDGTQLAPPPQDIPKDTKEKVVGGIGSVLSAATGQDFSESAVGKSLAQHHQQRLNEAEMHRKHAATYTAIAATGTDPETGKPLTPEEKQKYETWARTEMDAYAKIAGVSKESKAIVQKHRTILDYILQRGKQAATQGPQGKAPQPPPQAPAGTSPAPAAGADWDKGSTGGGGLTAPPKVDELPSSVQADEMAQGVEGNRAFNFWKRQQEVIRDYKIDEEKAKAKADADAKAANPTGRPVMGPALSVKNARELSKQGKSYNDADGNPIDLTTLPDSMGLKFVAWGGKHFYVPFSPNSKVVTVGNETYAISPMDVESVGQGEGTDLGQHLTPSETATTDPSTGQTTVAKHAPSTPGVKGRGTSPAAPSARPSGSQAKPTASTAVPQASKGQGAPPVSLDAEGHIPPTYPGSSPQVIEGANRLLDGEDPEKLKIPAKAAPLAMALARKFGWEQGRFTPKEQVLLKEATTFLAQARSDPSLSVLDDTMSKLKLGQVIEGSEKQNVFGRTVTTAASSSMTDEEAAFMRMYNQLIGTISGLGQLTKSGRTTEATIHRLMMELPNPKTTKDSADGKARIDRLLKEIDVAMEKGAFTGTGTSRKLKPPPTQGKDDTDNVVHWTRDANGKPVPAAASPH
jgi:hypothetical protein